MPIADNVNAFYNWLKLSTENQPIKISYENLLSTRYTLTVAQKFCPTSCSL